MYVFKKKRIKPLKGIKACLMLTQNWEPVFSSVTMATCLGPIICCSFDLPALVLLPTGAAVFGGGLSPIKSKFHKKKIKINFF